MKTMNLIDKLNRLMAEPARDTPLKKLRKTVRALRQKQKDLEETLRHTKGRHARQRVEQKIQVLRAQRRKGAERYRALKRG
jgi:hypothetical protein